MNPTSWKYNNYGNKDTIPCENKYAIFIGRYQPYHKGHTELIEQKINEGRPVLIMVRDVPVDDNNPFTTVQTMSIIRKYHESKAHKNVMVIMVPDIESVNWGRGVGYEMNEFEPPENIGSISATEIRNSIKEENDDWKESVDESIHTIIKKIPKLMIKIDFEKVKKVLSHKENKINHIGPIHKLIGLFKNKWEGCSLIDGHYNELITLEKELIEKIHGIKNN